MVCSFQFHGIKLEYFEANFFNEKLKVITFEGLLRRHPVAKFKKYNLIGKGIFNKISGIMAAAWTKTWIEF